MRRCLHLPLAVPGPFRSDGRKNCSGYGGVGASANNAHVVRVLRVWLSLQADGRAAGPLSDRTLIYSFFGGLSFSKRSVP
jgi:hypothetical protein